MERRIGPRGNRPVDVLPAEAVLPEDVVAADDGGGETGDAGLGAQRFEIIPEAIEQQILGTRRERHAQRKGGRQDHQGTAHVGIRQS